jgi:tetratricopeptide (TPR) repeat protein
MTCPNCGAEEQHGNYCAECGAELRVECAACGAEMEEGARFCPACGAGASVARPRAPWWIAGAAGLVVILILLIPQRAERAGPLPVTDPGAGAPSMGFTGDMRADADRLFNRVMAAAEQRQLDEVNQFMPMAIQAYEAVPDLDDDGLFHLAILYQTAGSHEMAINTAHQILEGSPNHILALGVAASSAEARGNRDTAREYYRRLIDGYSVESSRQLPEYRDHRAMVEEYHRLARQYLTDGG